MKKIYFTITLGVALLGANAQQSHKTKHKVLLTESPVKAARMGNHTASTMSTLWSDDFSVPANWTMTHDAGTGDWSIGTQPGQGGYAIGAILSTSAANGYAIFDSDFDCSFDEIANMTTTNSIDLTGHSAVRLKFQQYYAKLYDSTRVYISTNGTTWTNFPINDQYADGDLTANPETVTVDISSAAGNKATVWVRFTYYSPASIYGGDAGCGYNWLVDDAVIEDIPAADAAITAVTIASPDCDLTSSEPVMVDVKNNGSSSITGFSLSYNVNGGTAVTETYNASIAAGATATYTFTGLANLSAPGVVQTVAASVTLSGDADATNDKDTSYTENLVPGTDTLNDNFDTNASLIGWVFDGNNPNAWYLSATQHTLGGAGALAFNNGGAITSGVDEWVFSSCVNLSVGTSYYLEYWGIVPTSTVDTYDALLDTKIGQDNTIGAMTGSIASDTINTATYTKHHHDFSVTATGIYNIGFHATPYQNTTWFRIDDIVLGVNHTTGITKLSNQNLNVYPNPTNSLLNVTITASNGTVDIYNTMGQVVLSKKLTNGNNVIDMTVLSNGVYSVQVVQNNIVSINKVIKTN